MLVLLQFNGVAAEMPGKAIVEERCIDCHDPPDPAELTAEQWVEALEDMAGEAGLNDSEIAAVLEYLTAHEKKAIIIASMASEKRLFDSKCGQCHTTDRVLLMDLTPESRRHIVMRMQERAPDQISDNEVHEILEYLDHGAPESPRPEHKTVTGGPAVVFRERCTTCHSDARVHQALESGKQKGTAVVWAHIVNRMREKAPQWITEDESRQILQYLQSLKVVADE